MSNEGTDSAKRRFKHARLSSSRSIRLLDLQPSNNFDHPINVELLETSLDNGPTKQSSYEALSYVWGSQSGTHRIICDEKSLFVTPNCESALRYLRLKDRNRILWIDAICIDQTNSAEARLERNAQVASMGEIYVKADCTLCWLGEGTAYTGEVMRRLEQIGSCPSQRGFAKLMDLEVRLRAKGMLDEGTSCLDHVFCHPWHSRIWTVQEVAFSKQCQVVCGYSSLSWTLYFKAAKFLIFEQWIDTLSLQASRHMVALDMRNVVRNYVLGTADEDDTSTGEDSGDENTSDRAQKQIAFLTSCLSDLNQLQATEPKDKIYGIHAMYINLGVPLPPVDYGSSLASIYAGAARAVISWSQSLRILRDACSTNRDPTLPSWVPDWSDTSARLFMPTGYANKAFHFKYTNLTAPPGDGSKLAVRGTVIGEIVSSGDGGIMMPFPTRQSSTDLIILSSDEYKVVDDVEFLRLMIDKIRLFRALLRTIEANPELSQNDDWNEVIHELLTLGKPSFRDDLFDEFLDILSYPHGQCNQSIGEALVKKWVAADIANTNQWTPELINCATIVASLVVNHSITVNGRPLPSQADVIELVKELSENLGDHTVVTVQLTHNTSRTFGTTFQAVTHSDQVVLVEGADWPIVLRPSGQNYTFVGPAFVLGMMEDEAISQELMSQSSKLRLFTLV